MALEQEILEMLRALPVDQQQEVLDHARRLSSEAIQARGFHKTGNGLLFDPNAEEMNEARREMLKNFLRDDF